MAADPHELTGAYAADAVGDDDERDTFEQHLTGCPHCREEVRTLRETAAALAAAVSTPPPPTLRERVLAEISATPQQRPAEQAAQAAPSAGAPAPAPAPATATATERARRPNRWLAVAACLVLLAGVGTGAAGVVQLRRAEQVRDRADRVLAIVGDPHARRVSVALSGGGSVTVVVAGSSAVVLTEGMQALPAGRTYQLWLVRPAEIVSAGLGPAGGSGSGSWNRPIDGVRPGDSVAISVEPQAGSVQPSTTPVAVLRV
jgi:hypothetical protein